jgi:RimJ/RimL family protein N-acetyltransferase
MDDLPQVRLTPLRGDEDAPAFGKDLAPAYFGDEAVPLEILAQTRSFLEANPRPDPWGSYLVWDKDTRVGVCAFKSAPDSSGAVEIAYGTFPAFERRGYAKAAIAALFGVARDAGARLVFALTLARDNASSMALERQGFRFAGEVLDPEDGVVCRWELPV